MTRLCNDQAPVPLMEFRLNSKFDWNLECSGLRYAQPIITKFSLVQNFVVINQICYEQEHYKFSLNFEFDRNVVSGRGARALAFMISAYFVPCTVRFKYVFPPKNKSGYVLWCFEYMFNLKSKLNISLEHHKTYHNNFCEEMELDYHSSLNHFISGNCIPLFLRTSSRLLFSRKQAFRCFFPTCTQLGLGIHCWEPTNDLTHLRLGDLNEIL